MQQASRILRKGGGAPLSSFLGNSQHEFRRIACFRMKRAFVQQLFLLLLRDPSAQKRFNTFILCVLKIYLV